MLIVYYDDFVTKIFVYEVVGPLKVIYVVIVMKMTLTFAGKVNAKGNFVWVTMRDSCVSMYPSHIDPFSPYAASDLQQHYVHHIVLDPFFFPSSWNNYLYDHSPCHSNTIVIYPFHVLYPYSFYRDYFYSTS